jgi:3-dehydroquinate dehydratase-1
MTIRIGELELGANRPRIAVPVDDSVSPERIAEAAEKGMDAVEIRIDRFSRPERKQAVQYAGGCSKFPTLATIRSKAEGGAADLTDSDRLVLFEAVLPHVDAVDIEVSSISIAPRVIEIARSTGKTVIASFHDFESTPPLGRLRETVGQGRQLGADIVKVATCCGSMEDLRVLARLLIEEEQPLIVVGMGACAGLSRIFFPALGSLLTYSFLDAPVAPGQLSFEETVRLIGQFYPE